MNFIKHIKRKCKTKKGNVALETVLGGGVLFMVTFILVGYFVYLYPRYMVDLEVQNLANSVKLEGQLTVPSKNVFFENMKNRGYSDTQVLEDGLKVYEKGKPTISLISTDKKEAPVVGRNEGQIEIVVTVPAKNAQFLAGGLKWFGGDIEEGMKSYTASRVVMSEVHVPVK